MPDTAPPNYRSMAAVVERLIGRLRDHDPDQIDVRDLRDHVEDLAKAVLWLTRALAGADPMRQLYGNHAAWSRGAFGPDSSGPLGALRHLQKEVGETLARPDDPLEYVDMLFLVWDAARRAGFDWDDLVVHGLRKMARNKARTWPEPVPGQPCEHVRDDDTPDVPPAPLLAHVQTLVETLEGPWTPVHSMTPRTQEKVIRVTKQRAYDIDAAVRGARRFLEATADPTPKES